jgi:hypothetical protein
LPSSTRTIACVGPAAPIPNWSSYSLDQNSIPTACGDNSNGSVFSTSTPSVVAYDRRFEQPRSLRTAADWSSPILDNRYVLGVQGVYSWNMNQPGGVDINLNPAGGFTLPAEAGRPVFVAPSAIVPSTGAVSIANSRQSSGFQNVITNRSDLHSVSTQFVGKLVPVTTNRWLHWDFSYSLLNVRDQFYGFSGAGNTSGNPFDRERFAKELEEKPWLKEKIKHISLGENQDPRANAAVMETMMNRAVVRGTSLEQQAKRHRSSGVDEGGYYAGYAPHYSTAKGEMADRNLSAALRGSNITNYATDNSSGALAARERASGSFRHHDTINGESFFSPGSAEPALRDRWQSLNKKAQEHERTKTAPEVMTAPYTYGKQSSVAKPYKVAERGVPPAIEKPYPHAPDPHKFDEGDPEEPPPPAPIPNRNPPPIPGDEREPGFGIPSDYDIG